ncbi:MAG TPA: FkbM family methyltransferase [Solirubrobacteraceae bacterium]|nr:FkbM family methyltransferase [Solirubrobacteraceae bacterium]
MSFFGRALRMTLYRPGKTRPVLFGLGRGIKLVVDARAPLHKYIGTAEIELSRYIRMFAQKGALCFDVGAYDAHVSLTLARLTGSDVCSFEFRDDAAARIRRNLVLNPKLADRVELIQTYVADESAAYPPTDTLDDLIASGQVFEPDFVKIDVEGAEMQVLSGAATLLRERKPHLLIEIHSARLALECLVQLETAGYKPEPTIVPRRRWLSEHRGTQLNEWIVAVGQTREHAQERKLSQTAGLGREAS